MADLDNLEARVAQDRAALAASFDRLSDTFSSERIADEIYHTVQGYGGEIGGQAMRVAKQNPAAFVLVGAGLALLVSGAGRREDVPALRSTASVAMKGFDKRVEKADAAMRAEMTGTEYSPSALKLRAAMDRGLDKLPSSAKKRVLEARSAAVDAQQRVEANARKAAKRAKRAHNEHPLVTGALAFGIGAITVALLPSTRHEDEVLGAKRDALMAEAQRVLEEEMASLRNTAADALDEVAGRTAAQ